MAGRPIVESRKKPANPLLILGESESRYSKRSRLNGGRSHVVGLAVGSVLLSGVSTIATGAELAVSWLGGSGNWTSATQWSSSPTYPNNGTPPGATYLATIAAAGSSVTLNKAITLSGLTLDAADAWFTNSGTLTVNGVVDLKAGTFTINGALINARVQSEGGIVRLSTFANPTIFQNVDLAAPVSVLAGDTLQVNNTLHLDGAVIHLQSGTSTSSQSRVVGGGGSMSITGNGTINLAAGDYNTLGMSNSAPFTLGSGVTVNVNRGTLSAGSGSNGTLTNQGTINVAQNLVMVGRNIVNQGTINIGGGALVLIGNMSSENLGYISRSGGEVRLSGSLDNTDHNLDLSRIGTLYLDEGRIDGGTITSTVPATIVAGYFNRFITFSNASIGVNLSVLNKNTAFVNTNLISGGAISVAAGGALHVSGIGGAGTIVLNGLASSSGFNTPITGDVAPGITLQTGAFVPGYGGFASYSGINSGTILSRTNSQMIRLTNGWSNPTGSIRAIDGGIVTVEQFPGSFGRFSVDGGVLEIATDLTTPQLREVSASRATFRVVYNGTLDNENESLELTGNENLQLARGRFHGGTIIGTSTDQISVDAWGYLDHVATSLPINILPGAAFMVSDLAIDGSVLILNGGSNYLGFYYATTLAGSVYGSGTILFQGSRQNQIVSLTTVAPGITVQSGTGGGGVTNVENFGAIRASTEQMITLSGTFANSGLLEASNGGTVSMTGVNWVNKGVIKLFNHGTIRSGGLMLPEDSVFEVGCDPLDVPGLLAITGNLDLSEFPTLLGDFSEPGGPYLIATYTGTLTGAFSVSSPDLLVDYSHAGQILLKVVPEPVAPALVALASGLIGIRRRRCV